MSSFGFAVNRYSSCSYGCISDKVAAQRVFAVELNHTCCYHGDQGCRQINQEGYHKDYNVWCHLDYFYDAVFYMKCTHNFIITFMFNSDYLLSCLFCLMLFVCSQFNPNLTQIFAEFPDYCHQTIKPFQKKQVQ